MVRYRDIDMSARLLPVSLEAQRVGGRLILPAFLERLLMAQRVGPRNEQADNSVGGFPPLERVASFRGFHDGPSPLAHRKAEYTTATAPLRRSEQTRVS